ncbi:UNVERIFIED_CONTAM: hypothetical protein FKN15_051655 [Acipenser sinensis]
MNTRCPPKRVPSAARFFTLCRLTMQPPKSYSVGGQRSSRAATGTPAGARPDYRGRWCAVSRGHPDRHNPPSSWVTLGQLCAAPWELPSSIGKGIAWIGTRDLQGLNWGQAWRRLCALRRHVPFNLNLPRSTYSPSCNKRDQVAIYSEKQPPSYHVLTESFSMPLSCMKTEPDMTEKKWSCSGVTGGVILQGAVLKYCQSAMCHLGECILIALYEL